MVFDWCVGGLSTTVLAPKAAKSMILGCLRVNLWCAEICGSAVEDPTDAWGAELCQSTA